MAASILTEIHGREVGLDHTGALVVRSGAVRSVDGSPLSFPDGTTRDHLQRLLSSARTARYNNVFVNAVMSSTPTITPSASADGTLTKIYDLPTYSGLFRLFGGTPSVFATNYYALLSVSVKPATAPSSQRSAKVEFVADAAKIEIRMYQTTTTPTWRFWVDGQLATASVTGPVSANVINYYNIDFGSRARRKITVEWTDGRFRGVAVGPTEGIHKSDGDILRAVVIGDSFTDGAGTGVTSRSVSWAHVMCTALGIRDHWVSGIGGTGYYEDNSGTAWTYVQRLGDVSAALPIDALFVAGGYNDDIPGGDTNQLGWYVTNYIESIRALDTRLRSTPIFITGVWSGNNGPSATETGREDAIEAAVTALGDPNVFFVPVSAGDEGPMIYGTGYVGATTGNGNSDVYTSADAVHPTTSGHLHLGLSMADRVMQAIEEAL